MNKEKLKQVILSQKKKFLKNEKYVKREKLFEIEKMFDYEEVVIISWIRRAWKSVLLQEIMKKQKDKDYFLNFDDDRLFDFELKDFDLLYEVFLELFWEQNIFYFDEIQNVVWWEFFVRRLYNEWKKVYITGSNASMLSRELWTHLTWINLKIELFPFSFGEFLKFKKFIFEKNDIYDYEKKAKLKKYFWEYLQKWWFAQFLKNDDTKFFKDLYENILYKDIIVRHKLKEEKSIKQLTNYLFSNVWKEFSYTKLKNMLWLSNANTVKEYIWFLEETYLFFELQKFDYSLKKQIINPKKIYSIDLWFVNLLWFNFSENIWRNLENLVFIELKRRWKEIYYHKKKKECDFVVFDWQKITEAYQVTYSLDDEETKKREIDWLLETIKEYNLEKWTILTYDEEDDFELEWKKIEVLPIWKWMIEK